MLKMTHPEIESFADCASEDAFESVWRPRGWTLVGEAEVLASSVLGHRVVDLDDLTVDDLKRLSAHVGVTPPGSKKADYVKALRSSDLVVAEPIPPTTPGYIPDVQNPESEHLPLPDTSEIPDQPQEG